MLTLAVPPHLEGPLCDWMARDPKGAQQMLDLAIAGTIEAVLVQTRPPLSDAEFDGLLDQRDDEWEEDGGPKGMVPADDILSRDDIYGDHP